VIMVILIGNSFFFDFHGYFHGDIIHDIWENWLIIVVCIYIYYIDVVINYHYWRFS
jgi:hypothetical protein